MKAEIRSFHSPDIKDLDTFAPEDANCFSFLLQVMIGPKDGQGEESFDFEVCTPHWLLKHRQAEKVVFGRHMLIVYDYDFEEIKSRVEKYIENCTGSDWRTIVQKIARIGRWEFEDYSG